MLRLIIEVDDGKDSVSVSSMTGRDALTAISRGVWQAMNGMEVEQSAAYQWSVLLAPVVFINLIQHDQQLMPDEEEVKS